MTGFSLREYKRVAEFFETKFRKLGPWTLAMSIVQMADLYTRWMLTTCIENQGTIKIGTEVRLAPDGQLPDSIDASRISHGEVVSNYCTFLVVTEEKKAARDASVEPLGERTKARAGLICVQWHSNDWSPLCLGYHKASDLIQVPGDGTSGEFEKFVADMKEIDDETAKKLEQGEWPWPNKPCPWIEQYYRLDPISDEERKQLLTEGFTEQNNPEEFGPRKIWVGNESSAIIHDFKVQNGRLPKGIIPCIDADTDGFENRYPIEVYDGTCIGEWVQIATRDNFIPPEFFAESLKTFVGAICGHRIADEEAPSQENRFYTVLLSEEGGIGKSTAIQWTEQLLSVTGLLQRGGQPSRKHIGAVCDSFASGRAMIEAFEQQSRVIQVYDELATFVDSFSIAGAGQSLLGIVNTLYDSNIPPAAKIKGKKERPASAPKDCHNSILACSITDKWNAMFAGSSADNSGLFQRLNIIASGETRTVPKLKTPQAQMAELAMRIFKKIEALEYQRAIVRDTAEATALFEEWFEEHKQETKQDSADIRNRLQVLVQRNKNILAWALDDWTVDNLELKSGSQAPADRIVDVTADVMDRAIKLSKYQLIARRNNQPVVGDSPWVACENHITKILKNRKKDGASITRGHLYKKLHGERYGFKVFDSALKNLSAEHMIAITPSGTTKRTELIGWIGD